MTATIPPMPPGDMIPGTHFRLEPAWSHPGVLKGYLTIADLAYVFEEPERVVRGGAWLAGDEIEYLADTTCIPESLLDPILSHLAEVWERKHRHHVIAANQPITFAEAVALCATRPSQIWERFSERFAPVATGGYVSQIPRSEMTQ